MSIKERKHWVIALIITLFLALTLSAFAESEGITNGVCGTNLIWELNNEGVLTISGTGPMQTYGSTSYPWYSSKDAIKIVMINEGITSIGPYAFSGYTSINEIELPLTLTQISTYAFYGCSGITNLVIPKSVTTIGEYAFYGMPLTSITVPFVGGSRTATNEAGTFGYIFGFVPGDSLYTAPTSDHPMTYQYSAGSGTSRHYWYYIPQSLQNVIITDTTRISNNAFRNCTWFPVSIQSKVSEMGSSAFSNSYGVSSLSFLEGITAIPSSAFLECTGLQDAYIPDTVTEIGSSAFQSCNNLESVRFSDNLIKIESSAFSGCRSLTKIEFPSSLTTISSYAFSDCSGITSLVVPGSVTNIGGYAFYGMPLTSITVPFVGGSRTATNEAGTFGYIFGSVPGDSLYTAPASDHPMTYQYSAGNGASRHYWYYIPQSLQTVIITDTSIIPNNAFRNCIYIKTISLCEGIESIGDHSFYNCGIQSIHIPDSVISISDYSFSENVVFYMYEYTYAQYWAISNSRQYYLLDDKLFSEIGGTITIPESQIMIINDTYSMPIEVNPLLNFVHVVYESSDPNIVNIDENGILVASGIGNARISATVDDVSAYCDITVMHYSDIHGTIIIPETVLLNLGDQYHLPSTVNPSLNSLHVQYSSSDSTVVIVDPNGRLITVGPGKARISATIDDVTTFCDVTVAPLLATLSFENDLWIPVNGTVRIDNLVYTPEAAATDFVWASENSIIASIDENGFITGNVLGTTNITVTDNLTGLSASTSVRVCPPVISISLNEQELVLFLNETFDLDATVTMRNLTCTDRLILFECEDETVIEVDKKTGYIKAIAPGTTVVTASSANGITASCTVTVRLKNVLNLPADIRIIDDEAFTELPNVYAIRIPESVVSIAPDAFDKRIILLVPTGSAWKEWAKTNGYTVIEE